MDVTAGRDRLEAEAERQQQGHKLSTDMQMSMSGDVPSSAATSAMRTSKDGEPTAPHPNTTHVDLSPHAQSLLAATRPCHGVKIYLVSVPTMVFALSPVTAR